MSGHVSQPGPVSCSSAGGLQEAECFIMCLSCRWLMTDHRTMSVRHWAPFSNNTICVSCSTNYTFITLPKPLRCLNISDGRKLTVPVHHMDTFQKCCMIILLQTQFCSTQLVTIWRLYSVWWGIKNYLEDKSICCAHKTLCCMLVCMQMISHLQTTSLLFANQHSVSVKSLDTATHLLNIFHV